MEGRCEAALGAVLMRPWGPGGRATSPPVTPVVTDGEPRSLGPETKTGGRTPAPEGFLQQEGGPGPADAECEAWMVEQEGQVPSECCTEAGVAALPG